VGPDASTTVAPPSLQYRVVVVGADGSHLPISDYSPLQSLRDAVLSLGMVSGAGAVTLAVVARNSGGCEAVSAATAVVGLAAPSLADLVAGYAAPGGAVGNDTNSGGGAGGASGVAVSVLEGAMAAIAADSGAGTGSSGAGTGTGDAAALLGSLELAAMVLQVRP
jgi:hypothetical protein